MRFESPTIHFTTQRTQLAGPNAKLAPLGIKMELAPSRLSHELPTLRFSGPREPTPETAEPRPTGYEYYDRCYTPEGGIRHAYRDVERTLPIILGKLGLGVIALVATYGAGMTWSPLQGFWWNALAYVLFTCVLAFVLIRDTHVQRAVEIRPDGMIIEGSDIFWKANMPLGWPEFRPNDKGHLVFAGVYGTRWIEYLTIRRLDENDRAPEVFAEQVTAAMKSQWELPSKGV